MSERVEVSRLSIDVIDSEGDVLSFERCPDMATVIGECPGACVEVAPHTVADFARALLGVYGTDEERSRYGGRT